jgi:hypothetical protein
LVCVEDPFWSTNTNGGGEPAGQLQVAVQVAGRRRRAALCAARLSASAGAVADGNPVA